MEILVASAIGWMTAAGVYLILRKRAFAVVLGMTMITYAINVFLFATGRLVVNQPPILRYGVENYTDPLPQALVLTAIVISFGMTAVVVMMALGAFLEGGDDHVDMPRGDLIEEGRHRRRSETGRHADGISAQPGNEERGA